ncbi:hypothetical protein BGW80DRAFT_1396265, partial [Lactifluus volemus]
MKHLSSPADTAYPLPLHARSFPLRFPGSVLEYGHLVRGEDGRTLSEEYAIKTKHLQNNLATRRSRKREL